ncbi:TatD family hydrolase [Erysipelothrix sp. P66]|uniref:TatD family hydrolase n=1 Tax=Erysipelothrix sp. P66 TaxID=3141531 RepID=UPI00315C8733
MKMEYGWIDSHAHIASKGLVESFEALVMNAKAEGIDKICIICGSVEEIEDALEKTKTNPEMFDLAIGIHPCDVKDSKEEELEKMMTYINHPQVVCVGEIGLDYYWDDSNREEQKEIFKRQISIANESGKPIAIHVRNGELNAMDDVIAILKTHPAAASGIVHCYSDTVENAQHLFDMGFYIGVGGILTFKNGQNVRDVLNIAPIDRILTETDSPYLAPVPKRGKRNEPAFVRYTGEKIGELKDLTPQEVRKQIHQNYKQLFKR